MSSSQPMSTDAERIIDVDVMTVSCCNPAYMSLLDWVHVHWSFQLLCNCRVGMTYVRIVPSFITQVSTSCHEEVVVGGGGEACDVTRCDQSAVTRSHSAHVYSCQTHQDGDDRNLTNDCLVQSIP